MKSTNDILSIIRAGGNVVIDSSISTNDLLSIIRTMNSNNKVVIKGGSSKSINDLLSIVRAAGDKDVLLDLTE